VKHDLGDGVDWQKYVIETAKELRRERASHQRQSALDAEYQRQYKQIIEGAKAVAADAPSGTTHNVRGCTHVAGDISAISATTVVSAGGKLGAVTTSPYVSYVDVASGRTIALSSVDSITSWGVAPLANLNTPMRQPPKRLEADKGDSTPFDFDAIEVGFVSPYATDGKYWQGAITVNLPPTTDADIETLK